MKLGQTEKRLSFSYKGISGFHDAVVDYSSIIDHKDSQFYLYETEFN
jgi:hypothetical protein